MNWREMTEQLTTMSEDELADMINDELDNQQRISMIIRLHQRFNIVRMTRERKELLAAINLSPRHA